MRMAAIGSYTCMLSPQRILWEGVGVALLEVSPEMGFEVSKAHAKTCLSSLFLLSPSTRPAPPFLLSLIINLSHVGKKKDLSLLSLCHSTPQPLSLSLAAA